MKRSMLVALVACLTITALVAGEAFGRGGGGGGGGGSRGGGGGSRGGGGGGASRGSVRYSGGATPAARPATPAARPSTPAARPATQPVVPRNTAQGKPPGTTPARDASNTAVNRAQLSNGMRNNNAASTLPANTARIRAGEYPNYGARVTTLPTNNVAVVGKTNYWYAGGTYYCHGDNGYVVCRPPIAGHVPVLPIGHYPYWYANRRYYYYSGTYYVESGSDYEVVDPPVGSVIDELPPGAKEVQIGGKTYYDDNGTIYEAVMVDGEVSYRVVDLH